MPQDLSPSRPSCKVNLVGGQTVEISFKEFTLADFAWLKAEFSTLAKQHEILNCDPTALCKIIWRMLSNESKQIFNDIRFEDFDEKLGRTVEIKVFGYEKLLHSFAKPQDMVTAFETYYDSKALDDFLPEKKDKKKQIEKPAAP